MDAEEIKNLYMVVSGKASLIKTNILDGADWAWGNTDSVLGELTKLDDVVARTLQASGDIGRSFVSGCSVDDLVGKHGQQKVHDALISLVNDMTQPCEELKAKVDKTAAMHTIMTRD